MLQPPWLIATANEGGASIAYLPTQAAEEILGENRNAIIAGALKTRGDDVRPAKDGYA